MNRPEKRFAPRRLRTARVAIGALSVIVSTLVVGCASTPDGSSPDGAPTDTAPTDTAASSSTSSTPSSSPVASAPAPSATPSGSASTGSGSGAGLVGTWVSPSCGDRKYSREITLDANGRFSANDLVSPCPPKAVCVWSGIIVRQGTYTSTASTLKLVPDPEGNVNRPGEALVTDLAIVQGAPMEDAAHARCAYTRAP